VTAAGSKFLGNTGEPGVDNIGKLFHNIAEKVIMETNNKHKLEDIILLLREQKLFLKKKYKIKEIGVFGSYVRGEQDEESDLDILIDKYEPIGLLKLANLQNYLSHLMGVKVDLVIKKSLRPYIAKNVLKEVVYV
jgi:predicted nucleotidyltransferase